MQMQDVRVDLLSVAIESLGTSVAGSLPIISVLPASQVYSSACRSARNPELYTGLCGNVRDATNTSWPSRRWAFARPRTVSETAPPERNPEYQWMMRTYQVSRSDRRSLSDTIGRRTAVRAVMCCLISDTTSVTTSDSGRSTFTTCAPGSCAASRRYAPR